MRLLGNIKHPKYRIVAYTLENHYYVEIEAGPMKQCYKLHKEQTQGLVGIEKWLDDFFLEKVQNLFEEMYKNHQDSVKRNT